MNKMFFTKNNNWRKCFVERTGISTIIIFFTSSCLAILRMAVTDLMKKWSVAQI